MVDAFYKGLQDLKISKKNLTLLGTNLKSKGIKEIKRESKIKY